MKLLILKIYAQVFQFVMLHKQCRAYKEHKSVLCVALCLNTCVNNAYIRTNLPTYEHHIPEHSVY